MKFPGQLRNLCNANDGAALVEMALISTTLVLLVMGAVDLGRAGYVGIEVENAAHAGAEYGSLNPSDTATIKTAAQLRKLLPYAGVHGRQYSRQQCCA